LRQLLLGKIRPDLKATARRFWQKSQWQIATIIGSFTTET
jgi:hypothetical protein